MSDELLHYGTPRHSGRYPWGSGEDPYQRTMSFLAAVREMRREGMTEAQIAEAGGIKTSELRAKISLASNEKRAADAATAIALRDRGYSQSEVGRRMGINESSVRNLLKPAITERANITAITSNMLKDQVAKKTYLDIGKGVETHVGVSRTKLDTAIAALKEEGYKVQYYQIPQLGNPGKFTSVKVLTQEDTEWRPAFMNPSLIKNISDYSEDGGRSFLGLEPINNINQNRIAIRYGPEGGSAKDGVIELRRGVEDISLGYNKYAQVRIGVDGSHYLKGMAMYSDSMPDGVDIVFNTNKSQTGNKLDALKPISEDPDNPFGATVRQRHYIDIHGKEQLSALNIINEEGEWGEWSKTISSQVLSKQPPALAKTQLNLAYQAKREEFDEINSLTNATVKKRLLIPFADSCDAASEDLKAAALPRQSSHVILPIPDINPSEVYAPNYENGEKVVLIRHPHGGPFEIPPLTVNNKSKSAKAVMENAKDAVGIHPSVASILSGADFDGDSVIVIPNKNNLIKTSRPLEGIKDFDTKTSYPPFDGMKTIDGGIYDASTKTVVYGPKGKTTTMQNKMGEASNLITDMTIKGANEHEIARAVKYSMVVIDAEKHHLNYKLAYEQNGIASLKRNYQSGGASTLISRASSEARVPVRKPGAVVGPISKKTGEPTKLYIDPETGAKLYTETGETYTTINRKTGVEKIHIRKEASTKMREAIRETGDAHTLSSGTAIEKVYADHANQMVALANEARLTFINTESPRSNPSARATYSNEVESLRAKLNIAVSNSPIERQAQLQANTIVKLKRQAKPDMSDAEVRRVSNQALAEARTRTGASKQDIKITPREWEAIQAGAVSNNVLTQILNNTNLDTVKSLATPREARSQLSPSTVSRAKSMLNAGATQAEVSKALGVSISALSELI